MGRRLGFRGLVLGCWGDDPDDVGDVVVARPDLKLGKCAKSTDQVFPHIVTKYIYKYNPPEGARSAQKILNFAVLGFRGLGV